jgi:hypothetical protein
MIFKYDVPVELEAKITRVWNTLKAVLKFLVRETSSQDETRSSSL